MHTQRRYATCPQGMSKKRREKEKKIALVQKKETRERWFIQRSTSTIHQKFPHTCTSWLRFMTCFSFGSGFWLSKIWEASFPLYSPYLQLHQKEALGVGWKERHKNRPWWGIMRKWVIREIIEELHFSFKKFRKAPNWRLNKGVRKWHSTRPFQPSTAML